MASTSAAATQLRAYPAFPAAPHKRGRRAWPNHRSFTSAVQVWIVTSVEAYLRGPRYLVRND